MRVARRVRTRRRIDGARRPRLASWCDPDAVDMESAEEGWRSEDRRSAGGLRPAVQLGCCLALVLVPLLLLATPQRATLHGLRAPHRCRSRSRRPRGVADALSTPWTSRRRSPTSSVVGGDARRSHDGAPPVVATAPAHACRERVVPAGAADDDDHHDAPRPPCPAPRWWCRSRRRPPSPRPPEAARPAARRRRPPPPPPEHDHRTGVVVRRPGRHLRQPEPRLRDGGDRDRPRRRGPRSGARSTTARRTTPGGSSTSLRPRSPSWRACRSGSSRYASAGERLPPRCGGHHSWRDALTPPGPGGPRRARPAPQPGPRPELRRRRQHRPSHRPAGRGRARDRGGRDRRRPGCAHPAPWPRPGRTSPPWRSTAASFRCCAPQVEPHGVRVVEADASRSTGPSSSGTDRVEHRSRRRGRWWRTFPTTWRSRWCCALSTRPRAVRSMLVMVQREVGERLAAGPGDKAYGAVSVKVAYHATARVVGTRPGVGVRAPSRGGVGAGAHRAPSRRWPWIPPSRRRPGSSSWCEPASPTAARCSGSRWPAWSPPEAFAAAGHRPRGARREPRGGGVGETGGVRPRATRAVSATPTGVRGDRSRRPRQAHAVVARHRASATTGSTSSTPRWCRSTSPTRSPSSRDRGSPWTTRCAGGLGVEGVPTGPDNLVARALVGSWADSAAVRIVKRIPAGAGLGGGRPTPPPCCGGPGCTDLAAGRRGSAPTSRSACAVGGPVSRAWGRASSRCPSRTDASSCWLPPLAVDTGRGVPTVG